MNIRIHFSDEKPGGLVEDRPINVSQKLDASIFRKIYSPKEPNLIIILHVLCSESLDMRQEDRP
jgi:hypothetical protein